MALEIVNASAGSGKTYNLVIKYLTLILQTEEDVAKFSQIIAMTFTNKAAYEMKERIINALSNLCSLKTSTSTKAESIANDLKIRLQIEEKELIRRSSIALKQILHQFEDFQIMTIDKFNLRLIRSFSKELNISSDFKIVLNEDDILSEVIEGLIDSIEENKNTDLTKLIINYSKEKLVNEETWNFQNELSNFAKLLTNEKYFPLVDKLIHSDYSIAVFNSLKQDLVIIEHKIQEEANNLFNCFRNYDGDSLPGKSNTIKAYEKLVDASKIFVPNTNGAFFSDSILSKIETPLKNGTTFPEELANLSLRFNDYYRNEIEQHAVIKLVLKNFYNLSLLQYITNELNLYRDKEHTIRISEFNKLIASLIQDEYAPFIYEKLGNRYKHFLLDEFQDTSRLQWMNIVPLVYESLSNGNYNLIVGDAKQSIYRFKNGLAEQFVALPAIYNPENDIGLQLKSEYFVTQGLKSVLEDNYRSCKEIVNFNNLFFNSFKHYLGGAFVEFYKDVVQNPKGISGGYVEIASIPKEDELSIDTLSLIHEWVDELIREGYACGDICILGNTKAECNSWAISLSKKYKVVSDDSLLVDSDQYVKLTISYLKLRNNPKGALELIQFIELYKSLFSLQIVNDENSISFIEQNIASENDFFTRYESLYALLQHFYRLVNINEIENSYLHHLSDMVFEYDLNIGPDLDGFLKMYGEKGKKSSIQTPENKGAIKIMTGHKSKGLEFPIVILPNVNFSLESKQTKLLLETNSQLVYSGINKKSTIKDVLELSTNESNQIFLDKSNLLYVMMTRAIERLYIGNIHSKNTSSHLGMFVHEVVSGIQNMSSIERGFGNSYIYGESKRINFQKQDSISNSFIPMDLKEFLWFPEISVNSSLEETINSEEQDFGNAIHELLSKIDSYENIELKIQEYLNEGILSTLDSERIKNKLESIYSNPIFLELLDDTIEVKNEVSILESASNVKRLDKLIIKKNETIIVDFKTGGFHTKYTKQLQNYKKIVQQMDFPNVKAYLYYTNTMEIIEVA